MQRAVKKPYRCGLCLTPLTRKDTFASHYNKVHTGKGKHKCTLCLETVSTTYSTKLHLAGHYNAAHVALPETSTYSIVFPKGESNPQQPNLTMVGGVTYISNGPLSLPGYRDDVSTPSSTPGQPDFGPPTPPNSTLYSPWQSQREFGECSPDQRDRESMQDIVRGYNNLEPNVVESEFIDPRLLLTGF